MSHSPHTRGGQIKAYPVFLSLLIYLVKESFYLNYVYIYTDTHLFKLLKCNFITLNNVFFL